LANILSKYDNMKLIIRYSIGMLVINENNLRMVR
jgi:hypothetical protein